MSRTFRRVTVSFTPFAAVLLVTALSIGVASDVRAQWVTRTALFAGGGGSVTVLPEAERSLWSGGPAVEAGLGVGASETIFFRPSVTFARTQLNEAALRDRANLDGGALEGGHRRVYSVMGDLLLAPGVGGRPTRLAPYLLIGAGIQGSAVEETTYAPTGERVETVPEGTPAVFAVRTGVGVGFSLGGPLGLFVEANAELAFASEQALRLPFTAGLVYINR